MPANAGIQFRSFTSAAYNQSVRCLSCDYELANLTEHRCPECGRAFDPDDPATFESPLARRRHVKALLIPSAICAAASLPISFGYAWIADANSSSHVHVPVGLTTLVNWPMAFGVLFIPYTFLIRRTKKPPQ